MVDLITEFARTLKAILLRFELWPARLCLGGYFALCVSFPQVDHCLFPETFHKALLKHRGNCF